MFLMPLGQGRTVKKSPFVQSVSFLYHRQNAWIPTLKIRQSIFLCPFGFPVFLLPIRLFNNADKIDHSPGPHASSHGVFVATSPNAACGWWCQIPQTCDRHQGPPSDIAGETRNIGTEHLTANCGVDAIRPNHQISRYNTIVRQNNVSTFFGLPVAGHLSTGLKGIALKLRQSRGEGCNQIYPVNLNVTRAPAMRGHGFYRQIEQPAP